MITCRRRGEEKRRWEREGKKGKEGKGRHLTTLNITEF